MMGVQLSALTGEMPAEVGEALEVVSGFDGALVHGLARLGDEQVAALTGLAAAVAGTPLGERALEAAEKIVAGSVTDEHLVTLAGARSALLGAIHDALLTHLDASLTRTRAPWEAVTSPGSAPVPGAAAWLREVAIAGWHGVDHDLVTAADQTIEALLGDPGARRLAVLLDGLAAELRASAPVATMAAIPERRWGDLWARAVLLTHATASGAGADGESVSGRLLVLGVDVHEHATAVQVQVHGILEPGGRVVRASVAAGKVDTIAGPAVWSLFGGYPVLLGALAGHLAIEIEGMTLLAGGDLLWDEAAAKAGDPADPFATARVRLAEASAPAVAPLERHPVRIAEPVLVEGYKVKDGVLHLDGHELALDLDRLPAAGPLTPKLVTASTACIGLLRWDAGWRLQPLAVQGKSKAAHNGDLALQAAKGDAVAVLKERAGRLLRR